jgi:hypothetical protein
MRHIPQPPSSLVPIRAHCHNDPRSNAEEVARAVLADCIFVGARGLSQVERFLLGSVSSAVAARASCSVEVVRPAPTPVTCETRKSSSEISGDIKRGIHQPAYLGPGPGTGGPSSRHTRCVRCVLSVPSREHMASRCLWKLALMGSVTEKVVRDAPCSLLTVNASRQTQI